MIRQSILLLICSALSLFAGEYQVVPKDNSFQIFRKGKLLISSVNSPFTDTQQGQYSFKCDTQTLADGSKVWNYTSTDPRLNCRLEVALMSNGIIELTATNQAPYPYDVRTKPQPLLEVEIVPEFFESANFAGLRNRGIKFEEQRGSISNPEQFKEKCIWRYFTLSNGGDSVIFDMNPIGPGSFEMGNGVGVCRGIGSIFRRNGNLVIRFTNTIYSFGGMITSKLIIRDGVFEDYDQLHALRELMYTDRMHAQYLLSFGSTTHGNAFTTADGALYDAAKQYGWVKGAPMQTITTTSGAYYSHQAGKDGIYQLTGLKNGLHIVTVGAGNPTGTPNRFSVTVNGKTLLGETTIGKGRYLTASLPIWVDGGKVDIQLKGSYILSSIASQPLLLTNEDFQCRRGYWVTDGREPSILFNNSNYRPYANDFAASVKETVLPEHGQESQGAYHQFQPKITTVDFNDPANAWLFNAKIERIGNNTASFEELEDPEKMAAILDGAVKRGRNTVMFSGLHSRHTYPRVEEQTLRYLKRFCDEAHKRGIKVINHHDTTLLWNEGAGFRVLAGVRGHISRYTILQYQTSRKEESSHLLSGPTGHLRDSHPTPVLGRTGYTLFRQLGQNHTSVAGDQFRFPIRLQ